MDQGANLTIQGSKIYYAGDWAGNGGIELNGDGAIIENNEILGNFDGIDIRSSSNERIVNNTISNCIYGITYEGNEAGDQINTTSSNEEIPNDEISNNEISNCLLPRIFQLLNIKE